MADCGSRSAPENSRRAPRVASAKRYGVSTLAVMLDHLHVALRGDPRQSPLEIALAFQNHLAYLLDEALWCESFCVGTSSECTVRGCGGLLGLGAWFS